MLRKIRQFLASGWGLVVSVIGVCISSFIHYTYTITTIPVIVGISSWLFWTIQVVLLVVVFFPLAVRKQDRVGK